jgi:hypothetical protein
MPNRLNLVGRVFGKYTVLRGKGNNAWGESVWECECLCGRIFDVVGKSLTYGNTKGCTFCKNVKHGLARVGKLTREFRLWNGAKQNAKSGGHVFEIQISDIIIPEVCPLLGILLDKNASHRADNLPSLDRIDNRLGYSRNNIWVISWRANKIKNNASLQELKSLAENLEQKLVESKINEAR